MKYSVPLWTAGNMILPLRAQLRALDTKKQLPPVFGGELRGILLFRWDTLWGNNILLYKMAGAYS